jgi:hypothetical protein
MLKLQDALHQAHDTAVGPDNIHYQMLKHLPENISIHIGIAGNTAADATAKAALCLPVSDIHVPHTDFKTLVFSYTSSRWQQSSSTEKDNKLHKIQPTIKPVVINRLPCRDEVTIHRLRIGHTHFIHSYLLHRENPLECDFCHLPLTAEHILVSCLKHNLNS